LLGENDERDIVYYDDVAKECEYLKNNRLSVYDAFNMAKKSGWPLWSAAPFIANRVFNNLVIKGVGKAPGKGPSLNIVMQSKNYETGLCCWLLWNANLFPGKTHKDIFGDFDT
jgi:hypothetical protein